MEIYQNVWRDKKDRKLWMEQFHFGKAHSLYNQSLMSAIDEYQWMNKKLHEYVHTMVSDPECGTCKIINVMDDIHSLRTDGQKEWDKGCDEYHIRRNA